VEYVELPKYIAAMDICLIPISLSSWTEISLSNKFFEYSACGKTILTKPSPNMLKVGEKNLFTYQNRKEFITRIRYIIDNPKTYNINMEKYSWKNKAVEFEEVLRDAIGSH